MADNGLGIDPANHHEIFEPFKRVVTSEVPGTGLGLSICQSIVSRYGGRMWVESEIGEGATFLFAIPEEQFLLGRKAGSAEA